MEEPARQKHNAPTVIVWGVTTLAILLWGGTPIANKIAIIGIDPATIGILRPILAGPVALLLALSLRLPFPPGGRNRFLLFVAGVTNFAIWPTLLSVGIGMTSAAHAGLIIAQIPVFTGLFTALLDRRWPHTYWWIGTTVAVIGTFFLIVYRDGSAPDEASVIGDLIILAGVQSCAIGYIVGGKLVPVIGTRATTFWGIAIAAVVLVPVVFAVADRTDWSAVENASWLGLIYLAFLGSFGAYLAWFWALNHGGITRISTSQLAQPVVTLVLAAMILGEIITLPLIIIAGVIVLGAACAQRPPKAR